MKRFGWFSLFLLLTLTLAAQSKGKRGMTLRVVGITVTDPDLVRTAQEQEAQGNTRPKALMAGYAQSVRAKLDEVASNCGRFELSDRKTLDSLSSDTEDRLFMSLSKEERILYISTRQNDYALSGELTGCQFTRRAGGAGWSCVLRLKLTVSDARNPSAPAIASREFVSNIKQTKIRPDRSKACQEALATLTEPVTQFFLGVIPAYGLLDFEADRYVVTCGSSQSIRKGDKFQVSYVRYTDGGRQSDVVGVVEVKEVRAESCIVSFDEGKQRILDLIPTLDMNSFLQCRLLLL
ncbi:MAG: hypothetical protein LBL97_00910 [Prevotellaceae bacterium]|jgi:hypothetical protein|nr:hypothetical protein [Prevotellaceae bacterium]